ncbi:MAG: ORF6N domain-containing protein [Marinilabiliaceae bacterium]|nr:ORF6N domain-containing protein [Marinilabiliaceae bacterium]
MTDPYNNTIAIPEALILRKIHLIRQQKVMLDRDLAELYGVETKVLKQQVKRNLERFPEDFMFVLTHDEFAHLRSQYVTSSWGGARYAPMVFTEQGVAMLSSVLRSPKAIQVNIQIMRLFTKMRQMALSDRNLKAELETMKFHLNNHDKSIRKIFSYLDCLIQKQEGHPPRPKVGFKRSDEA